MFIPLLDHDLLVVVLVIAEDDGAGAEVDGAVRYDAFQ